MQSFFHQNMERFTRKILNCGSICEYKCLQILANHFNYGPYCSAVLPILKYCTSLFGMVLALTAVNIRQMDVLEFAIARVAFFILAIYVYGTLAVAAHVVCKFWTMSAQHLCTVQRATERIMSGDRRKHLRKIIKSLRPIRMNVGGLYHMEKSAKLTFMGFLLYGTGRILIAFS